MTSPTDPSDPNRTALDEARHWIEVLVHVRNEKKKLDELEKAAKAEVQARLGDREVGTLDGHTVVKWTHGKTNRFNQAAFKKDHPNLVAEYTEASVTRRFEVI